LRFDVLTLHPAMVAEPLSQSMLGRAQRDGLLEVGVHDIRDHAGDRYRSVDDGPYGGGAGMVLRVDVVAAALRAVATEGARVLLTSPAGRPLTQADCRRWAAEEHLVIVTGHYEGIDARIETLVDEEVSLGDFVLTGGEIAAVAIVDAVGRLVPGVLGNAQSAIDESFTAGLLEYPHYTRPRVWEGHEVPEVLLSGHHARIAAWRHEQAVERTRVRRPDLHAAWVDACIDAPPTHD
jgi:tRNA (guanine37-N1)-methyltransferase